MGCRIKIYYNIFIFEEHPLSILEVKKNSSILFIYRRFQIMDKLKIYTLEINDFGLDTGMDAVSLVENPAVEIDFLTFSESKPLPMYFDDSQHIITGVSLLADTPIYRDNAPYGPHYIIFTKETIRKMVEKYSKLGLQNSVNLEHLDDHFVGNVTMLESYFIDHNRNIVPNEFSNIPDGSWITSFKVNDLELWKAIKEGKFKGFSIQGYFNYGKEVSKDTDGESLDSIINKLL